MKFLDACVRWAAWLVKFSFVPLALLVALRFVITRGAPQEAQTPAQIIRASPIATPEQPTSAADDLEANGIVLEGMSDITQFRETCNRDDETQASWPADEAYCDAIARNNLRKVSALLKFGVHANARNYHDLMPLLWSESKAMTRLLVAHGADVNAEDGHGNTPLIIAAHQGSIEVARTLIRFGANPNKKNRIGWTAFSAAADKPDSSKMRETLYAAWQERAIIEGRRH